MTGVRHCLWRELPDRVGSLSSKRPPPWALLLAVLALLASACAATPPTPAPTSIPTPTAGPIPSPTTILAPTATVAPTATRTPRPPSPTPPATPAPPLAIIDGHVLTLEVAATPEERSRGLMARTSLSYDAGMLFVYPEEQILSFWMKNTLIPLDILFLDSAGIVVNVRTMEPEPGVPDAELTRYRSAGPARYALEMNAGLAEVYGIVVGSHVEVRLEAGLALHPCPLARLLM